MHGTAEDRYAYRCAWATVGFHQAMSPRVPRTQLCPALHHELSSCSCWDTGTSLPPAANDGQVVESARAAGGLIAPAPGLLKGHEDAHVGPVGHPKCTECA